MATNKKKSAGVGYIFPINSPTFKAEDLPPCQDAGYDAYTSLTKPENMNQATVAHQSNTIAKNIFNSNANK